ncbi:hypothetical protein [Paenibacillus riograndensis]|uniref:Uncharacterized protein n=1 Tax=Paenibacillus riograndensis SBR5 TaxID=1073571 RepID=A0A0E4H768_9BACL|nr:hypothetical protein [Paenibacillus riograndensis]CQR51436.1 hypothetical protein PRIO_0201 [Paenibacillus riograndensis SBR5]
MENQVKRKSIGEVLATIDPEKVNLQLVKPALMEVARSNTKRSGFLKIAVDDDVAVDCFQAMPDKIRFIISIDREDWNRAVVSE